MLIGVRYGSSASRPRCQSTNPQLVLLVELAPINPTPARRRYDGDIAAAAPQGPVKNTPWSRAGLLVGWLLTLICREWQDNWTDIVPTCDHN
jgi:hypothetical protein